jgi:hypothetical protein
MSGGGGGGGDGTYHTSWVEACLYLISHHSYSFGGGASATGFLVLLLYRFLRNPKLCFCACIGWILVAGTLYVKLAPLAAAASFGAKIDGDSILESVSRR